MEKEKKMPVTVVLDGIRSMNNVGSFFRTCDAFGVEKLVLCGITAVPPNREIHKTALGAELTVQWEYFGSTLDAIADLRAQGWRIVAVEQAPDSVLLADFVPDGGGSDNGAADSGTQKFALVFGNEVTGVSAEVLQKCDTVVEIPQFGAKKSLNVAVAGGVVLWHFCCHTSKISKI